MNRWISLLLLLVLGGSGATWYWLLHTVQGNHFRTLEIERGPFLAAITANGVTQPIDPIDVGAQVAGRIDRLGIDPRSQAVLDQTIVLDLVLRQHSASLPLLSGLLPIKNIDFNSPVDKGTILAQIDDAVYRNDLDLAKSGLDLAKAELAQVRVKMHLAEHDWQRAKELSLSRSISVKEFDTARYAYEGSQADLSRSQAAVSKAEVNVRKTEINLDYATVRSTVRGVIISRRVTVGQTVVASLSAPSLFLMARDLRKMQIAVSVNEADIAQIHPGQEVRFSVEALRDDVFVGVVSEDQPRLEAIMTSNVVTYTVMVDFDNSDLKLKPYMTANVRFVLDQKPSALLIPNAALRWRPTAEQVTPAARPAYIESLQKRQMTALEKGQSDKESAERTVWVEADGYVRPVKIQVGLTDGTVAEVLSGALHEGDHVVAGEEVRGEADNGNNPFAPQGMYGGSKKKKS